MAATVPAQKEDRVVFTCGPNGFSVRDIIDAAHFRGEIDRPWRDFLRRAAAEQRASETGAEAEGSAIDEAAVAFRYDYDLITAEETEAWLEARGLTLSDFSEYFARDYWGKTHASRRAPDVAFIDGDAEQRGTFTTDLILSGELDRMATRLAWRVAARAATKEISPPLATSAPDWLQRIGRDEVWFNEIRELEAAYEEAREKVLTPEAIKRELTSLRLPLTRLEVEMMELESRHAANEALMCVRDDGMSMAEVAHEGRYPFRRTEMLLEEVQADQQQKFLSLTTGSILDPIPREDGFVLSRLLAKHEPNVEDPQVRARIEDRILQRHFTDITSGRIQWPLRPGAPA
ncbi:MAG: hypothetical protein ACJ8LI_05245 [Chthoniobacterales bacterium]